MAVGFVETFQDEKKPGRTLLQSGAGLLQTRRPNTSEDVSPVMKNNGTSCLGRKTC